MVDKPKGLLRNNDSNGYGSRTNNTVRKIFVSAITSSSVVAQRISFSSNHVRCGCKYQLNDFIPYMDRHLEENFLIRNQILVVKYAKMVIALVLSVEIAIVCYLLVHLYNF